MDGGPALEEVPQFSPSSGSLMANTVHLGVMSPDGQLRVWVDADGAINLAGEKSRTTIPSLDSVAVVQMFAYSPNGRFLAAAGAEQSGVKVGSIEIWQISGGDGITSFHVEPANTLRIDDHYPRALAIAPDNATLLVACTDGGVSLYNLRTGQLLRQFVPHFSAEWGMPITIDCLAVSDDGRLLATWAYDGIRVWDYQTLSLRRQFQVPDDVG